jgi:hypothetical protein
VRPEQSSAWLLAALIGTLVAVSGAGAGEAAEGMPMGPLKLGLFIPTEGPGEETGRAVQRGAALALETLEGTRCRRGFSEIELVVIPSSLAWGAQMGELVQAVYDRGVRIILGGIDREAAHLAGQFVAREKGEILFISLGDDPTVTQTGVPWLLRLIPPAPGDDGSQPADRPGTVGDLAGVEAGFGELYHVRFGAPPPPKAILAYEAVLRLVGASIETGIDPDRLVRHLTDPSTGGRAAHRWTGSN